MSGNTAGNLFTGTGRGGGVFATRGTFLNATIVENRAFLDIIGGGGVFSPASAEPIRVRNTIMADNFVRFEQNDLSGTFASEGNNLIGRDFGTFQGFGAPGDLVGEFGDALDVRLGPLANNGGPTKTHALRAGSPAIDQGSNVGLPATDQRGLPRVRDGNGDRIAVVDIGAFER